MRVPLMLWALKLLYDYHYQFLLKTIRFIQVFTRGSLLEPLAVTVSCTAEEHAALCRLNRSRMTRQRRARIALCPALRLSLSPGTSHDLQRAVA
jgi:hypothetical protein